MHMCKYGVCEYVCTWLWKLEQDIRYPMLSAQYSFETESLTEVGARLEVSKLQ